MSYLVLARKWRPLTFDQMVGQEFISRTLKNAVQTGRVAHAFLFTGCRGVGKTSAARILAKCLNCDQGPTPEPCNQCTSCREITEGRSMEVYEIDGASNTSVDDVRELRENIRYMPRQGKHRIYIIDEVHMLSKSAFNALLKTLEEPPEHVVFMFATTEPHKVPETIQSRCQRYDFRRIPRHQILHRLKEMVENEQVEISETALAFIAKAADGSMRDAQSLLDQVISFCGQTATDEAVMEILGVAGPALFFRISEAVLNQDAGGCIETLDELYHLGHDTSQFYRDLVEHFRNLLVSRLLPNPERVLEMAEAQIQELKKQAALASPEDLQRLVSILQKSEMDILGSSFPRMGLEVALIRMAHTARLEPLEKILEKLTALEQSVGGSSPPPTGSVPNPERKERTRGRSVPAEGSIQAPDPVASRPPEERAPKPAPPEPKSVHPEKTPTKPRVRWDTSDASSGFIEAVRQERDGLAALLEDVSRWEIDQKFVKAFCEEGSFLYEKLRQPDVKNLLTRIAQEVLSPSIVFKVCSQDEPESVPAPPDTEGRIQEDTSAAKAPPKTEQVRSDPVVKEAMDLFHGTITEVKHLKDEENEEIE